MGSFDKNKYKFSTDVKTSLVGIEVLQERKEEVERLMEELESYNILIKDLVVENPSHNIRNIMLNIASFITGELELFEYINQSKDLPIEKIIRKIPIAKSFLIRWRDYIILYVLILSNSEYEYLNEYLNIVHNIDIMGVKDKNESEEEKEYRGIVFSIRRKAAIVLTSSGQIKKIKINEEYDLGEEVEGNQKKTIGNYKIHIFIVCALIALIISMVALKYNTSKTIILVETTSNIKLEANSFDKVIKYNSFTDKGKTMLESLNLVDKNVDDALCEILNYSISNDMIPEDGIIITVTGKAIEYGQLEKCEKLISDKSINVKFNNSGDERKFDS